MSIFPTAYTGPWVDAFFAKVSVGGPNDCWLWMGSLDTSGYGQAGWRGNIIHTAFKIYSAHRASFVIHNGFIPMHPLQVLHTCDVRRCTNPNHFYVGTNGDNMDDRNRKGRTAHNRGEKHGRSKLTWEQVRAIREEAKKLGGPGAVSKPREVTRKSIAAKYGISLSQVSFIIYGLSWVEGENQ